jgi:LuxR family maltose regulon positive regulatory protein
MTSTISDPPRLLHPVPGSGDRSVTPAPPPFGLEVSVVLICLRIARERDVPLAAPAPPRRQPGAGPERGEAVVADVGDLLARLAAARLSGDSTAGLALATRIRDLLARLPVEAEEAVGTLTATLAAHIGALEVNRGHLHEAADTLAHGAALLGSPAATRASGLDCAGQLALVEAFRGDLEKATRHAAPVCTEGDSTPGAVHGRLAMAWTHLERCELGSARGILDRLPCAFPGTREPWLATALLLAQARLLTAEGRPDAAVRHLAPAAKAVDSGDEAWLADLITVATAEALMVAGEPHRALALVSPGPTRAGAEAGVLAAAALRDIGDLRGARAALAAVAADVPVAPLGFQILSWLLEAQLEQGGDRADRSRLLVDRALRAASAEGIRRPLASESVWLGAFVERDLPLRREHRALLDSLRPGRGREAAIRREAHHFRTTLPEALTARELEVLELLAEMYATEEIASALHLSVNTVKTHIKGVFRKLSVNRRTAAVRRGREFGLC